jgi:hypothetical protein
MRAGSKRYVTNQSVDDRPPTKAAGSTGGGSRLFGNSPHVAKGEVITGREVVPEDQIRDAPRITKQPPSRNPGSAPAKSVVATSEARPAADPMLRRADVHSIPTHRTQPHHAPLEAPEEQTFIHGFPVSKRKLEAFSELLKTTESKISEDPRAVGPAVRALGDAMMKMHLDHVGELNKQAMGNTDQAIRDRVASARAGWARESAADPARLMDAQAAMHRFAQHDPQGHAELVQLLNHSGLGDHPAMAKFGAWVNRQRLPNGNARSLNAASQASQGREYRSASGAPSAMSKAGRLYQNSSR